MLNDYCFLDLETTGFEPNKDSILEVSFIRIKNGKEIARFDHVFLPDKSPLTPFISGLTGITEEELNASGKKLTDDIATINEMIGDSVIIGHNIDFDIGFLIANGIDVVNNPRLDTHELARILLPGEKSFALEVLSRKYDFIHEDAHRAMSDVEASVELFDMLLKKIEALPVDFLQQIKPFLETKTNWYARQLFLEAKGGGTKNNEKNKKSMRRDKNIFVSTEFQDKYTECTPEKSIFWRIGDSVPSAEATMATAQKISETEEVLIISSKIDFYEGICKFPTPEVLLDPDRLEDFVENRDTLDNLETTFYIKSKYRQHLGFRGLDAFDLFFKERDYWKEVHVQEVVNPVFQSVIKDRKDEKIMVLSPRAFFRFHDLELFKGRTLIIDEAEFFVSELLNYPTQTYSLYSWLESKDEQIANKTIYYVSNFCKEVIEKKLEHAITPFPAKVLLEPGEKLSQFAEGLRELCSDAGEVPCNQSLQEAANILETPETGLIRWVVYFPETGNLTVNAWRFADWEALKNSFQNFKKIIQYRHRMEGVGEIFKTFLGVEEGMFFETPSVFSSKKLTVPTDLMSANSPGFNAFCADKIVEIYKKDLGGKGSLVVNFSSLETLRGIYDQVTATLSDIDVSVVGEKVNGGDGKVLEILKGKENVIFFTQKFLHPALAMREWEAIVMQKFPFPAPTPLMEMVEKSLKTQGKNFWDVWTIPQVAANISRRISNYPSAKKFYFLDPRENSRWGKDILKRTL